MKKILSSLLIVVLFVGCGYKEPEVLVEKEKEVIYITPSASFTKQIDIPAPMPEQEYLALNLKDKEKTLGLYSIRLLNLLHIENDKKVELQKYIDDKQKDTK